MTPAFLRKFEFIGFEPSAGVIARAKEHLGRVFGESPSDSTTFAFIKKTARGFEGCLQVRSAAGTFVAHVIGDDPLSVVRRMSRKVRSQLRIWKRDRVFAT